MYGEILFSRIVGQWKAKYLNFPFSCPIGKKHPFETVLKKNPGYE